MKTLLLNKNTKIFSETMRRARRRNREKSSKTIAKSFDLKLPNSAFVKIINFEDFTGTYSVIHLQKKI